MVVMPNYETESIFYTITMKRARQPSDCIEYLFDEYLFDNEKERFSRGSSSMAHQVVNVANLAYITLIIWCPV